LPFVKFGVYIPTGQAKQRAVFIQESQVEIEEFSDTWRAHHPYLITSSFIITTTIIIFFFFNHSFLPSLLHSFIQSGIHSFIQDPHPTSSRITCFISHPATPIPFIQKEARSPDTPRVATIVRDNGISSLNWDFEDGDGIFPGKILQRQNRVFAFQVLGLRH